MRRHPRGPSVDCAHKAPHAHARSFWRLPTLSPPHSQLVCRLWGGAWRAPHPHRALTQLTAARPPMGSAPPPLAPHLHQPHTSSARASLDPLMALPACSYRTHATPTLLPVRRAPQLWGPGRRRRRSTSIHKTSNSCWRAKRCGLACAFFGLVAVFLFFFLWPNIFCSLPPSSFHAGRQ